MPTQIAADDFNRSDGGLGGNWTATKDFFGTSSVLQIISNQAAGDGGGNWPISLWTADSFPDDQYIEVTMIGTAISPFVVCMGRGATNGSGEFIGYMFGARLSDSVWAIWRVDGASAATALDSGIGSFSSGDVLRFELVGSALAGFQNGSPLASASDSTYTSGAAGLGIGSSDAKADDWSAGSMAAGGGGSTRYTGDLGLLGIG